MNHDKKIIIPHWLFLFPPMFFGIFFLASPASAFQVKNVQSVSVSLSEEETQQSVNLPETVDWSRTLLWNFQSSTALVGSSKENKRNVFAGEGDGFSAVFPESSASVLYRRGLSHKPVNGRLDAIFYAVEFKDGVKVHRGITRFDPEVYAKNIAIPTFDSSRSFPSLMMLSSDPQTNQTEAFVFKATLQNSGTLRIERGSLPTQGRLYAPAYADVYWQVVEFDEGVTVRSGELKIVNNNATMRKVLPGLPLKSFDQSMLLFNYSVNGKVRGDDSQIFVRGYIQDVESLRFSRGRSGDKGRGININLVWYLLEFDEGTSTQAGSVDFSEGETFKEIKIEPVAPCCSLPTVTAASMPAAEGDTVIYEADHLADRLIKAEIVAPDTLRLSRQDSEDYQEGKVQAEWQVVEFAPFHLLTPAEGEVLRVGEPYDFIWSHADCVNSYRSMPGADTADFSLVYPPPLGHDPVVIPLLSGWKVADQAFRLTMPAEINGDETAGYPLRMQMKDRRAKPKTSLNPGGFAIKGRLKLLDPMGGAVWLRDGATNRIRWQVEGIKGDVAIYYDDDGGKSEYAFRRDHFISKVTAGGNPEVSYLWDDMPDLNSKKMRLKVMQVSDPTVFSISKFDFTVYPKITVTQPKAGETGWQAHTQRNVIWETNGRVERFNLLFRTGKDQVWQKAVSDITGGPAGSYSAAWDIPGEASGATTELRIESASNARVFGVYPPSGQFFSVGPWIRLEGLPAEGTQFKTLDKLEVRWAFEGAIGLVMIEYSTDDARSWIKQAVAEAADGVYAWHFLNLQAEKVLIRVSDLEHSDVRSTSTVAFAVGNE